MRVHVTSVFSLFVALLFISGAVGCHYTGSGPRYSPTSYTFVNPFDKGNQAPKSHYASESTERSKPSQAALPNTKVGISPPPGGFTDGGNTVASRSDIPGGTASTTPPEHWGVQNHVAPQTSQGGYAGYTNPEPSQYAPQQYQQSYDSGSVPASYNYPGTTQQYPVQQYSPQNQYPGGAGQPTGNTMPSNAAPTYGAGQSYDGSNLYGYQPRANTAPADTFATNQPSAYNSTVPNSTVPQPNYGGQPAASPSGYAYDQPVPSNYPTYPTYPNEGMTVASPYTPPPAPTGVYQ